MATSVSISAQANAEAIAGLGTRTDGGRVARQRVAPYQLPSSVLRKTSTQQFGLSERQYNANTESPIHAHVKTYMIVTLEGNYRSTFDQGIEEFSPWTVTYHQAGMSHNSRYAGKGAKVLYVEIPHESLSRLSGDSPSHLGHFSLQGGLVEWTARQLYREFDESDGYASMAIEGLVMQLMAYLMRNRATRPQRLPVWLGKANEIIRTRFTESIAIPEVAKSVHVHPGHLAREYTRHFNCTIGEQIRKLRVEYACEQLSTTTTCLADIALEAGFSDQSHFTVSFKQQVGMTPSAYRRATKECCILKKM